MIEQGYKLKKKKRYNDIVLHMVIRIYKKQNRHCFANDKRNNTIWSLILLWRNSFNGKRTRFCLKPSYAYIFYSIIFIYLIVHVMPYNWHIPAHTLFMANTYVCSFIHRVHGILDEEWDNIYNEIRQLNVYGIPFSELSCPIIWYSINATAFHNIYIYIYICYVLC